MWEPERLAARLVGPSVEGISILGGEPFEQAAACARLAEKARDLGATVITYSGYTWSYLQRSSLPEVAALLAASDVLIAGPYQATRRSDARRWMGSSNQELVFLTNTYSAEQFSQGSEEPLVEGWADGAFLTWSGIPSNGDLVALDLISASQIASQFAAGERTQLARRAVDEEGLCPHR
jgi:organic radical activating enzyme